MSTLLSQEKPWWLVGELKKLKNLELPAHHQVLIQDVHPDRLARIFLKTYERQPEDFEQLLGMIGVGPKTIRALSLIAELVYGAEVSFRDPVRYSFAHGGKDGHPYPVDGGLRSLDSDPRKGHPTGQAGQPGEAGCFQTASQYNSSTEENRCPSQC